MRLVGLSCAVLEITAWFRLPKHQGTLVGGCTTEEPYETALRLLEVDQEVAGHRNTAGHHRASAQHHVNWADNRSVLEATRSIPFGAAPRLHS